MVSVPNPKKPDSELIKDCFSKNFIKKESKKHNPEYTKT